MQSQLCPLTPDLFTGEVLDHPAPAPEPEPDSVTPVKDPRQLVLDLSVN